MWKLRLLGLGMVAYGGIMLLLLQTQYRDWALDHSIAEVVSRTDRRVNNTVDTADEPMAIAGSAVMIFAGLWIGLLVPFVMDRSYRKQMAAAGYLDDDAPPAAGAPPPEAGQPPIAPPTAPPADPPTGGPPTGAAPG
ncbi:MAG: hypothetical protein U0P45_03185 [Acidimicrobiales bacterium]